MNEYLNCLTKSGDSTLLIDLLIARIVKWKSLILSFGHQTHLGLTHLYYDWSSDGNWLVPPVHCIPNVLKHMLFYKCVGTLVVPKWKSALFWPCIELEHKFKWFVKDVIPKRFFSEGSHKESVFARSLFMSNVLVLKIDCG